MSIKLWMPTYESVQDKIHADPYSRPNSGTSVRTPDDAAQLQAIRNEMAQYFGLLKELNSMDPAQVFQVLSSISARLSEIRNHLVRYDRRNLAALRTKEVDPMIEEIDRQFKIHSRLASIRQTEWEMSGKGQV